MLARFVARVATLCVAVGRLDGVPGTPTGTPRVANVGVTVAKVWAVGHRWALEEDVNSHIWRFLS
jgi:hypothetical protein